MAPFDSTTALRAAGLDRHHSVVEIAERDDYAAALIDSTGEGTGTNLRLYRRTADGRWDNLATGDGEAVSDGRAIAVWDAGNHEIVLGYVAADGQAEAAPVRGAVRGRGVTLVWLTFLSVAIWPAAAGAYVWEGATSVSLFFVVQMLILATVAFLVLRSLVRLWRGARAEATPGFALALALAAALLLVISYSPMTDDRLAAKPVGVLALLVGVNLAVLAVREGWQSRARRRDGVGS